MKNQYRGRKGRFAHQPTWFEALTFFTTCGVLFIAMIWLAKGHQEVKVVNGAVAASTPQITQNTALQTFPDPCTLAVVTCPNKFYAETTEYTKIETCPNHQCHTADGRIPEKDKVAACPRRLRLGTRLLVADQEYTCTDRTANRFDGRFDLYHGATETDYEEAIKYGKQVKEITILE